MTMHIKILNYTRRCKKREGSDLHQLLHAADNLRTFCGKELNEMWFVESSAYYTPDDITCKECKKVMRIQGSTGVGG